ncbi:SCO6880 family protein [Nocardiopsis sp. NRRL B-16309]|uniref:SCO6880 family protein n=1 Tax=Nocardiopsis sp. NRRL B-16309 TaxID=1519494 RepID=UPI0006AEFDDF|nr:SCO6880 family protein [Nocardiopsis sp. NRRL B-16309]KOX13688.1 hypothetical protein ADL05_18580 [Nocardiopsis sp. NRRL B-16309]
MEDSSPPRTYGGWRRSRGVGFFGLGMGGTLTLLGAFIVLILTAQISPPLLLWVTPPALLVAAAVLIPVHGEPVGMVLVQRLRWAMSTMQGHNRYKSGVLTDHPHAFQLPGLLAPLQLKSASDGLGSDYGVVWNRRTGHLTATLRVAPSSIWLADVDEVDTWVANWGNWLSGLGHMPQVLWVAVTVDTAPEAGSVLAERVYASLSPEAPERARDIMTELVHTAPAAAADVETRVTITFDPGQFPARPKTMEEAIGEVGHSLSQLETSLAGCGVAVVGRASAAQVAAAVRVAFDPDARGPVDQALDENPDHVIWEDAGPIGAHEHARHYEHSGALSVSWAWNEAPRQNVQSQILAGLLSPTRDPKRVTLFYRAYSAQNAARILESEVNAADFRAAVRSQQGRDESARDAVDQARARQAAQEEAAGAGVSLMTVYATVTVTDPEQLPRAVAEMEASAETCKIRLRRLYHSQAAGFAATLPCGIFPPALAYELRN